MTLQLVELLKSDSLIKIFLLYFEGFEICVLNTLKEILKQKKVSLNTADIFHSKDADKRVLTMSVKNKNILKIVSSTFLKEFDVVK